MEAQGDDQSVTRGCTQRPAQAGAVLLVPLPLDVRVLRRSEPDRLRALAAAPGRGRAHARDEALRLRPGPRWPGGAPGDPAAPARLRIARRAVRAGAGPRAGGHLADRAVVSEGRRRPGPRDSDLPGM